MRYVCVCMRVNVCVQGHAIDAEKWCVYVCMYAQSCELKCAFMFVVLCVCVCVCVSMLESTYAYISTNMAYIKVMCGLEIH
jgi:hypothetical protein